MPILQGIIEPKKKESTLKKLGKFIVPLASKLLEKDRNKGE